MGRDVRVPLAVLTATVLASSPARATKICIDPGHGGYDPGAVGCGLKESNVVLDVGLKLRDLLKAINLSVIMTRSSDTFVPLSGRTAYANANGAHRFVSLHCNSAASVATGIETYRVTGASASSTATKLASAIQARMLAAWPLADRGIKTAGFYVLKYTNMAATLTEMGFINNCPKDATYQASASQRTAAAKAHLFALQQHLGLPVTDPGQQPVATTGTIKGVVFEDQGQGTADMSLRLPGAKLQVTGHGASATAAATDAAWSFELKPGSYTIEASMTGYKTNQRTCEAKLGQTAWCSIGLSKAPSTPQDAGLVAVDADQLPTDGSPIPADSASGDDADQPTADSGGQVVLLGDGGRRSLQRGQDGCSMGGAHGAGSTLPSLLLLPALAGFRRRRTASGGGQCVRRAKRAARLLMLLGCIGAVLAGCQDEQVVSHTAKLQHAPSAQPRPAVRISDVRMLASGDHLAPALSPSGRQVAYSSYGFKGLLVQATDGSRGPRSVTSRERAGYRPLWLAGEDAIGLRPADEPFGPAPLQIIPLRAGATAAVAPAPGPRAVQKDDCIYLVQGPRSRVVACGGDKFFAPQLSGDGKLLVYCGLSTGLRIHRLADRRTISIGAGHHPALSGDGRWLVFARSSDDGQQLTASDLWIVDLWARRHTATRLTHTPQRLEQHPSLSRDGSVLAFSAGGAIYVARLVSGR